MHSVRTPRRASTRLTRTTLLAAAILTGAAATPLPAQEIDTLTIRAVTRFLADDHLGGRGTGTPGERIAAAYISSELRRAGLQPLGSEGTRAPTAASAFLLPVPLRSARVDPTSRVRVVAGADTTHFASGRGFIVNTGGPGAFRDFSGPAVYLGRPADAVRLTANRPQLAGRVAVLEGAPGAAALEIMPALVSGGAAGLVLVIRDRDLYQLYVRSRGESRYFVNAPVDDPVWQPELPVLIAGPELSEALVGGRQAPETAVEAPPDLGRTLSAELRVSTREVPAANVGAVLRGSDPGLRDEFVVYTAHYDHLGISTPDARGDSIYNGFSDNAAGVAMLLAIADAMAQQPPARSVAFLFFTGEERGLLGSSYLASASPVPLDRVAALINLDAGAPPAPPVTWRIAGGTASPLGALAADIAQERGWTATLSDASPNSDYWPFLRRGVPSVFIIPGDEWENTTPAERDALRARWDRYHRADDHWHADFPFAGLQRYAEYALLLGRRAANRR